MNKKSFILFFFLLGVSVAAIAQNKDSVMVYDNEYIVKVGDMAPDFTLELTDGSTFTLSEQRGKVVMLQFTAGWCGVCRKEMPFIERDIWQRHKGNGNFVLLGIDREELPFIFDRFYKIDKSRGLDKSGVGLGLYICKTVIDAHGEKIYALSPNEDGAEFVFTLPSADDNRKRN